MASDDDSIFHHRISLALQRSIVSDDALLEVLKLLGERFRCLSAALVYVDDGQPGATIDTSHGVIDAAARRRYRETYAQDDPAPSTMARLTVGEVATTDHLFDIDDEAYARFRDEFYYPLGLRGTMGGPVVKAQGRFGVLAVQRGADRPVFNDDDTLEFARLIPLVASALALRRKFFELESGVEKLQQALEHVPVAILMLYASGRLRHANRLAREFLARQDGLVLTRSGRLRLADGAANLRFQDLFSSKPMVEDLIMQVPRSGSGAPYVLRVSWVSGEAMVRICDPRSNSNEAQTILMLAFNMRPASARLTASLLRGESVADHAKRAGLSPNTMKFHLRQAFVATATQRQSDLVRVASAIVREVGS